MYTPKIEITCEDDFDVVRTYKEYGIDVVISSDGVITLPQMEDFFKNNDEITTYYYGITHIHLLHNCIVVKTCHLGNDIDDLQILKEKLNCKKISLGFSSIYIPIHTTGFVYNVYYDFNCCKIKYPK